MTKIIQALMVLLPGWVTAYLTDGQIAYVAPVLAASAFLASAITRNTSRVDDAHEFSND